MNKRQNTNKFSLRDFGDDVAYYFYFRFMVTALTVIAFILIAVFSGKWEEIGFLFIGVIIYSALLVDTLFDVINGKYYSYIGKCIRVDVENIIIDIDGTQFRLKPEGKIRAAKIGDLVKFYIKPSKTVLKENVYIVNDVLIAYIYKFSAE